MDLMCIGLHLGKENRGGWQWCCYIHDGIAGVKEHCVDHSSKTSLLWMAFFDEVMKEV